MSRGETRRRTTLPVVLAVLGCVAATAAEAQTPAAGEGGAAGDAAGLGPAGTLAAYRSVREGSVHRFTLDYRGGARVRLGGSAGGEGGTEGAPAAATQHEVHVRGTWVMRVYRRADDGSGLVGWALASPRVTVRQAVQGLPEPDPPDRGALEDQLGREVLVRLSAGGGAEALLVPPGLPPLVEAFWKQWADQVLLRLPDGGAREAWTARGDDRVGRYRDAYRLTGGGEIRRVREAYRSLHLVRSRDGPAAGPGLRPPSDASVASESRYQVNPGPGWLASGSGHLVVQAAREGTGGAPAVTVARSFRFVFDSLERRDAASLRRELADRHGVGRPSALPGPLEVTAPGEPATARTRGEQARTDGGAGGEGRPPAELLQGLEAALAGGDGARAARLRARLRERLARDPELVAAVDRRAAGAETSPGLQGVLLDLLAKAGTPPAQSALADWVRGRGAPPAVRRRALLALVHLDRPSDELYERVREVSEEDDAPAAVRRQALRMFGALTSRRDVRSFGPEGPVELLERLEEVASSADSAATRRAALHALGNTRLPTAVGPIRDVVAEAPPGAPVLEAAVAALGHVPSTTAVDALVALADARPDAPVVQQRVVAALAVKVESAGPEGRRKIRRELERSLRSSPHVEVRLQVVSHYVERLRATGDRHARSVLETAAAENSSRRVRERAGEALGRIDGRPADAEAEGADGRR